MSEHSSHSSPVEVLALVKGAERYVFLYDDATRAEVLRVFGRFASNPELSFTWYDAAVLSQKVRQEVSKQMAQPAPRAAVEKEADPLPDPLAADHAVQIECLEKKHKEEMEELLEQQRREREEAQRNIRF